MGCWNKTCGVTNFPIRSGQPAVWFVLIEHLKYSKKSKLDTQPCYANAYWDLLPLPIFGEYNDYGGLEEASGQSKKFKTLQDVFGDKIVRIITNDPKDPDYNQYHCAIGHDTPFTDSESLDESVHSGAFGIANPYSKDLPAANIATFMVHKSVYDSLCIDVAESNWKDGKRVIERWTLQEIADMATTYFKANDAERKATRKKSKLPPELVDFLVDSHSNVEKYIKDVLKYEGYHFCHPLSQFVSFMTERGGEGSSPFMKSILSAARNNKAMKMLEFVKVWRFYSAMVRLRKTFTPQSGEGSQDDFNEFHPVLMKAMQAVIDKDKADRAEWGDDEEEEYPDDVTGS